MEQRPKKLLDQACTELAEVSRQAIRLKHYSVRTEEAYVGWITRFILFHNRRHPNEMGSAEIEAFPPTWPWIRRWPPPRKILCTERSRSEALSALLFLYREVLKKELDDPIDALRAQKPKRLPSVLTKEDW